NNRYDNNINNNNNNIPRPTNNRDQPTPMGQQYGQYQQEQQQRYDSGYENVTAEERISQIKANKERQRIKELQERDEAIQRAHERAREDRRLFEEKRKQNVDQAVSDKVLFV